MIDLHCHLLPGIDDGPKTLEDALALCRQAVKNGIRKAVATPHIIPGRYNNNLDTITETYNAFRLELENTDIELELGMAAEVRFDPAIPAMIKAETVPFLGEYEDGPLMLLEFPHTDIPPDSMKFVDWLLKEGIRPMIAHPERNGDVIYSVKKIEPFVKAGCLLQITGSSLTGLFGKGPRKRGIEMLKKGWVSIIASDAHNLQARSPELEPGRLVAANIVGEKESWMLVRDRPAEIAAIHFE